MAEAREMRRMAGTCVHCGGQREPTIAMCRPCADKQNAAVKRSQAKKRAREERRDV